MHSKEDPVQPNINKRKKKNTIQPCGCGWTELLARRLHAWSNFSAVGVCVCGGEDRALFSGAQRLTNELGGLS